MTQFEQYNPVFATDTTYTNRGPKLIRVIVNDMEREYFHLDNITLENIREMKIF